MDQYICLTATYGDLLHDPGPYRCLVGRLIYLTIIRLDILYSVHIPTQFMHSPRQRHYMAALHVLQYLIGTLSFGLLLPSNSLLQLIAHCDSDWATCPMTRRSITDYFNSLDAYPLSWKIKKQPIISRSSTEAEYRAMAVATYELVWLKALLQDLGVPHPHPMCLYCVNHVAVHITANLVFHERTKHIELDCHRIQEKIYPGILKTSHVSTKHQVTDIITKALSHEQFQFLRNKLAVTDLHAPI
ncbi:hypothetical protein AMTRI_Chr02g254620 [Amborella trichopoda]